MTIRILVTGSREWDDRETLYAEIVRVWKEQPRDVTVVTFVHGACPRGADAMLVEVIEGGHWIGARIVLEAHPADWATHGKAAGPIRNQRMVDLGADLCLAFPTESSRGTWDCIKRANRAGIPVRIVPDRGAKK